MESLPYYGILTQQLPCVLCAVLVIFVLLFLGFFSSPLIVWAIVSVLLLFGAKIGDRCVIKRGVRIKLPWKLKLGNDVWLGEGVWIDNIETVEMGNDVCISQEAYLCTGSHEFDQPGLPLITAKIHIGRAAFVGARAFVLPGVRIGEGAIIGACSVVTSDVAPFTVNTGTPCRMLRQRSSLSTPCSETVK